MLQKLPRPQLFFDNVYQPGTLLMPTSDCRFWVADVQGIDGTWITEFDPFIREYGVDGVLNASIVENNIPKPALYLASVYWAFTTASLLKPKTDSFLGTIPAALQTFKPCIFNNH